MKKKIYLAVTNANLENNVIYIASLQFRQSLDGSMPIWKQGLSRFSPAVTPNASEDQTKVVAECSRVSAMTSL